MANFIEQKHVNRFLKEMMTGNKQKVMLLSHEEFLRRFEQRFLPKGFMKIRHAGFSHSKDKMKRIAAVCEQLKLPGSVCG